MNVCLPKEFADKFRQALEAGKIVPEKIIAMTSSERRAFLEDIVGKENAREVNGLLESKLLLKDQKRGLVTWAKQVAGLTEKAKKDLISRIEGMTEFLDAKNKDAFLEDLAGQKLGVEVTFEEAKTIADYSTKLSKLQEAWDSKIAEVELTKNPLNKNAGWKGEEQRYAYGFAVSDMRAYIADLKNSKEVKLVDALKHPLETAKTLIQNPIETIKSATYGAFGLTKSLLSSLDNSFFGRQGIKVLYTHPSVWAKAFLKSWGDIANTIKGKEVMRVIEADVLSRPNALNGKYQASGIDVGISFEEAFPTSIQDHIPGIGRFFKAADTAFSGGAMRIRADLADMLIPKAEEFGLNMKKGEDARGLGRLINSMTGRGYIGGISGKAVNATFFSLKFLKSNIDTITGHTFLQGDLSPAAKSFLHRQSATNLLKIVGTTALILSTAKALDPNSTSLDPRSSRFGKIKISGTTFDITGGMGSLVTLAARLVPTEHNGKWSFWSISSKGNYTDLVAGKYGQQTALDVILDFGTGKLSPIAGALRDMWKGENFNGEKPTILNTATGLVTPLPIQTYQDLTNNPNAAPLWLGLIGDGLGFSTYTPPPPKKK